MDTGKSLRLRRFSRRSGAVIIPMDHALFWEPPAALADLKGLVKLIAGTAADGILITPGMLGHVASVAGDLNIILRVDGTHTRLGRHRERTDVITTVDQALAMGADMVVANIFVGADNEDFHLAKLGRLATDCRRLGMPLLGEMIPNSILDFHYVGAKRRASAAQINRDIWLAARLGAEIGADVIKTQYSGDAAGFAEIVRSTPVPIWIAGGPLKKKADAAFLAMVEEAVEAGARGVVIGRNVWQRTSPREMIAELCRLVHR